jgi:putative hydrolase of the HAD superfamily
VLILKIFFDVDGVLIDGWHGKPERRKRWDATIERDLGVDSKAFQERFFDSPTAGSPSLMHACLSGACDLKEALARVLPSIGYAGQSMPLSRTGLRKIRTSTATSWVL